MTSQNKSQNGYGYKNPSTLNFLKILFESSMIIHKLFAFARNLAKFENKILSGT